MYTTCETQTMSSLKKIKCALLETRALLEMCAHSDQNDPRHTLRKE